MIFFEFIKYLVIYIFVFETIYYEYNSLFGTLSNLLHFALTGPSGNLLYCTLQVVRYINMISFETASGENTVCSQSQWSLTQVGMNSNLPGTRYPLVPKFYI